MKEFKEELFELMLKHASKELVDEMVAEYPSPEELKGKYDFSPEFEKRIEKILESERKRKKYNKFNNIRCKFINTGKRIAIAVCIVVATFSVVAFTVPPIRVALLNFCIERNDEYISFDLQDKEEDHIKESDDSVSNIISYIPEGFEIENIVENESALIVTFVNNNIIIHFERYSGATNMTIDRENIEFEKIMIGDNEGYTSSKNGRNIILFNDEDYGYKLSSDISIEELKKMAESILK